MSEYDVHQDDPHILSLVAQKWHGHAKQSPLPTSPLVMQKDTRYNFSLAKQTSEKAQIIAQRLFHEDKKMLSLLQSFTE